MGRSQGQEIETILANTENMEKYLSIENMEKLAGHGGVLGPVAHTCNPSTLGGQGRQIT